MMLSITLYITLIAVNSAIHAEAKALLHSTSSVIIKQNETICEVHNGVLSINNKVIGNLTVEQKEELEKYIDRRTKSFNNFMKNFLDRLFGSMKNVWNNAFEFSLDFFSNRSKSNKTVDEKANNQSEFPDDDVDALMDITWDMPSFCKSD
ncbi:unnamed protein product [Litomosoides sigmodontis]|uniref:Pepsin inhibitor-3-like repeated domain-containing protein n=1 Tax=Litomosoides sigmodontis TaxID=42156 RepID=A0A3P6SB96_LITSI|nr:unnamed protein product [Litomosoides sigmodontis]